jgi:hypothetical protein
MTGRKSCPGSVCLHCHKGGDVDRLGLRCQCGGQFVRIMSQDDWRVCSFCEATGFLERDECLTCRGDGWLYDREP